VPADVVGIVDGADSINGRRPIASILDEQGAGISSGAADTALAALADSAPDIDAVSADAGSHNMPINLVQHQASVYCPHTCCEG
jgi:hypothetical protein